MANEELRDDLASRLTFSWETGAAGLGDTAAGLGGGEQRVFSRSAACIEQPSGQQAAVGQVGGPPHA